jgi:hypothetical protein
MRLMEKLMNQTFPTALLILSILVVPLISITSPKEMTLNKKRPAVTGIPISVEFESSSFCKKHAHSYKNTFQGKRCNFLAQPSPCSTKIPCKSLSK